MDTPTDESTGSIQADIPFIRGCPTYDDFKLRLDNVAIAASERWSKGTTRAAKLLAIAPGAATWAASIRDAIPEHPIWSHWSTDVKRACIYFLRALEDEIKESVARGKTHTLVQQYLNTHVTTQRVDERLYLWTEYARASREERNSHRSLVDLDRLGRAHLRTDVTPHYDFTQEQLEEAEMLQEPPKVNPPPLGHPVTHPQLVRLCEAIATLIDEKHPLSPGQGQIWQKTMLAEPICSAETWRTLNRDTRIEHCALFWSLLQFKRVVIRSTPTQFDELMKSDYSPSAISAAQSKWVKLTRFAFEQYNARSLEERKLRRQNKAWVRAQGAGIPHDDEERHPDVGEPASAAVTSSRGGHPGSHPALEPRARDRSYSGPPLDLEPRSHRPLPGHQRHAQEANYSNHRLPPLEYLDSPQAEGPVELGPERPRGTGDSYFPDPRI